MGRWYNFLLLSNILSNPHPGWRSILPQYLISWKPREPKTNVRTYFHCPVRAVSLSFNETKSLKNVHWSLSNVHWSTSNVSWSSSNVSWSSKKIWKEVSNDHHKLLHQLQLAVFRSRPIGHFSSSREFVLIRYWIANFFRYRTWVQLAPEST